MSKKMTLLMATMFVVVLAFFAQGASQAQTVNNYVLANGNDGFHYISLQVVKTQSGSMGTMMYHDNMMGIWSGYLYIGSISSDHATVYVYSPGSWSRTAYTKVDITDNHDGTSTIQMVLLDAWARPLGWSTSFDLPTAQAAITP